MMDMRLKEWPLILRIKKDLTLVLLSIQSTFINAFKKVDFKAGEIFSFGYMLIFSKRLIHEQNY